MNVQVTVSLPIEMIVWLDTRAKLDRRSRSETVSACVRSFMEAKP